MISVTEAVFQKDDEESGYRQFDRLFESPLQQPEAASLKGILFGRFQRKSAMTREKIQRLISLRPQLSGIPIIADLDFGHTSPIATLPVGGHVSIDTSLPNPLTITRF